jgi:hypothetical protein
VSEMIDRIARRLASTLRHHGVEMHPEDIRGLAQDALAEMREPDRTMSDAGRDATGGYPYAPHDVPKLGYMGVAIIWRAMIAATLHPKDNT